MTCAVSEHVVVSREGAVATVKFGQGSNGNALPTAAWRAIAMHAEALARDEEIRVVVVRGSGETFCAGYDIRHWRHAQPRDVEGSFTAMEMACAALENLPFPTIAAIEGVAAGGGCQLALACDLRISADNARLGMPILRLGILTPATFARRLVRTAGRARSYELLYTGRLLTAAEAERYCLVDEVVLAEELTARVTSLAREIAAQPTRALSAAKMAVQRAGSGTERDLPGTPPVHWPDFQAGIHRFLSRAFENDEHSGTETTWQS